MYVGAPIREIQAETNVCAAISEEISAMGMTSVQHVNRFIIVKV